MIKQFNFLTIAIVLITGYAVNILAQGNSKKLQLPINDSNLRNKSEQYMLEAESAKLIADAFKVPDSNASGGYIVCLTKQGEEIKFPNLPTIDPLCFSYCWYCKCYSQRSTGA